MNEDNTVQATTTYGRNDLQHLRSLIYLMEDDNMLRDGLTFEIKVFKAGERIGTIGICDKQYVFEPRW